MGRASRLGRTLRTRVAPWLVWLATMGAVVYLWQDSAGEAQLIGFAQGTEYRVAPLVPGRISAVAVEVGQEIEAGQVVATLDAGELDARVRILEAERARVDARVTAEREAARQRLASARRALDRQVEDAEAALARARAGQRVAGAQRKALGTQRELLEDLVRQRLVSRRDLADVEVRYETARQEAGAGAASVALLEAHVAAAKGRRAALREDAVALAVAPLEAERAVVDGKLARLRARRDDLVLRAPTSGLVSAVLRRPGEVARIGEPLVSLVGVNSDRVVACVSEEQALGVHVGGLATLTPRGGTQGLEGRVVSLGPLVDEVPLRCRRDPRVPAWGRDVVIRLQEPRPLLPGQAFDVRLERDAGPSAAAHATAPAPPPDAPRRITVPPSLAALTRFEPSGAVWVPRLARYVVVSDDTGRGGASEHVPWLFTMDLQGVVDADPLPVEGVEALNDLESVAALGDRLYILASQSHSKKGKRRPARQLFARLEPLADGGRGYRLAASVRLAELLDAGLAADPELGADLGLSDTRALDVEGLAPAPGGGLLLGLKAPLTADGRAILWRLRHPDRLLASGRLGDGELARYGTVRLEVERDGGAAPGGVAELLRLPTGALLIAATASDGDGAQSGALWQVARPEGGAMSAGRVRSFPGLKPEALALAPQPGRLVVLFDRGSEPASWLEMPWPQP